MRTPRTLLVALAALATSAAFAAAFTPGNVVILQVGADGSGTALTNAATPVFLKEFTPSGTLVQTIAVPDSGSGLKLTNSGTATSNLQTTLNAGFISFVGYDAATGSTGGPTAGGQDGTGTSIVNSAPTFYGRTIARVGLDGTVNLTTSLSDAYHSNNFRNAVTSNGTDFWTAGTASPAINVGTAGVRYATLGGTTSLQLASDLTNTRVVNIFDGQLYVSSASGAFVGISTVGTGLPIGGGQTTTLLPGLTPALGGTGTGSPYDFEFVTLGGIPTLYIADDRNLVGTNSGGGVLKYQLIAGSWTFQYRLNDGVRGATSLALASVDGTTATLYYVARSGTGPTALYQLVDNGPTATPTLITSAPTNTAFRGVEFIPSSAGVPVSGNVTLLGLNDPAWRAGRTVDFVLVDGSNNQTPFTANLDASGNYSATVSVAPGTYTLYGKTLNWLRRTATVTVTASGATGADLTLDNGDANEDNITDGLDLGALDASFNLALGETGFNTLADFNKDDVVDGLDLAILDANFNNSGDELP